MTWDKIANLVIGFSCLHIEHSLIVETLPLYHLPVVDSDAEQQEIHELSEAKLDRLVILDALLVVHQEESSTKNVDDVCDHKVPEEYISHEKEEAQGHL